MSGLKASLGTFVINALDFAQVVTPAIPDAWVTVFGADCFHNDAAIAHHMDIFIQPVPAEGSTAATITSSVTVGPGAPLASGFIMGAIREFRVPPGWRIGAQLRGAATLGTTFTLRAAYLIDERKI